MNKTQVVRTKSGVRSDDLHLKLTFASVGLMASSRFPWEIIVRIFTVFAVGASGVVTAVASAMHHIQNILDRVVQRQALLSVSVAPAGTSYVHFMDGVIVLFLHR